MRLSVFGKVIQTLLIVTVVSLCRDLCVLLVPAATELRFMPDPPTLNIHGIHRMNKSDNVELTCRYAEIHLSELTHAYTAFICDSLHPAEVGST